MGTKIVVTVNAHGEVTVLTDSPGVQVLVIDRDVEDALMQIEVDGAPAAMDSLLDGLARMDAQKVKLVFDEVSARVAGPPPSGAWLSQRHQAQYRHLRKVLARTGPAS